MSPRQALVSSKRGVHPSERGVWKRSSEPFVFCRICNREAEYLMKFSLLIASRVSPANFSCKKPSKESGQPQNERVGAYETEQSGLISL
jgi:hypothetical protein